MRLVSAAMAAGLSAAFAVSSVVPAQALQIAPPSVERQASTEIVNAKVKIKIRKGQRWKRHRHAHRRYHHRRHWRAGHWRGGHWRPGPAVILKVRPGKRWGNRHVRWCRSQYVSYRKRDNSWQPYNGPRRTCISPYRR